MFKNKAQADEKIKIGLAGLPVSGSTSKNKENIYSN